MRFAANVSTLFREYSYLERFVEARAAGFDAVETWWPRGVDLDEVVSSVVDAGVDVVLMNIDAGDMAAGDRGLLADPRRSVELRENVPVALELAQRIGVPRVNALVGLALPEMDRDDQLALVTENLRWIADAAAPIGIEVLIEAVNTIENGPYLVATTADAECLRRRVDRSNVRIQYDAYHMQRMEGNLAATIERHIGAISHVQIADSPARNQPGTGEIAFPYLLRHLRSLDYSGYVGLEYLASGGDTRASLAWLPREQRAARTAGPVR